MYVRTAGVHPLLGEVPPGTVDHPAEDGRQSLQSISESASRVVSAKPVLAGRRSAPGAEPEAARSLRVLRDLGQLSGNHPLPPRSVQGMAEVAESPLPTSPDDLGTLQGAAAAVSAASTAHACRTTRGEAVNRGAGCGKAARPYVGGAGAATPRSTRHISYNYVRAIEMRAGSLSNAQWKEDYTDTADSGPALMEDIYIYRNVIYKNGYISYQGSDILYNSYVEEVLGICPLGENETGNGSAIYLTDNQEKYHGSFKDVYIVNNTIANNYGYGVQINISYSIGGTYLDNRTYHFSRLNIMNNVISGNTGGAFDGAQLKIYDGLSKSSWGSRGFLCSSTIDSNCLYNSLAINGFVVNYQNTQLVLYWYSGITESIKLSPTGSLRCTAGPFGRISINENPMFVNSQIDLYKISYTASPCVNHGRDVDDLYHYETGDSVTLGPDYEYRYNMSIKSPDIGAYETLNRTTSEGAG
jgi:hypothetical protein